MTSVYTLEYHNFQSVGYLGLFKSLFVPAAVRPLNPRAPAYTHNMYKHVCMYVCMYVCR